MKWPKRFSPFLDLIYRLRVLGVSMVYHHRCPELSLR